MHSFDRSNSADQRSGRAHARWIGRAALSTLPLAAAVLSVPGTAVAQLPGTFDPAATYRVSLGDGPVRGPADAPITIVEFSDFGCQFCGRAQATLAQLQHLYPGAIRVAYRHNPLDIEDGALAALASVAAARQGQFWAMHDLIFAAGGVVTRAEVDELALQIGLDIGQFRRDLGGRYTMSIVAADAAEARRLGIASTPMFFVNGRAIKGALPVAAFVEVIEQELAAARSLMARGVAARAVYATRTRGGLASATPAVDRMRRTGGPVDPTSGSDRPVEPAPYQRPTLDPDRLYRVGLGAPGHVVGPADALLTVIVFSDFQCPYCAKLSPVLTAMREAYPDDLRIVLRHLPLDFHPRAQLAAEAVVAAAAQGRVWEMHEAIFSDLQRLSRADLERHAQHLGLDMSAFRAALDDRTHRDVVAADAAEANALAVFGTPTLFINGTPVQGVAPFDYMREVFLEPKLEEARALLAEGVARADVFAALMKRAARGEIGARTRFPIAVGAVEMNRDEYRTAVMQACRARDAHRAHQMYEKLGTGPHHDDVRVDCQAYGVDLPR